ncbi:MAG TPA: CSLREA domain-containing protein, partial [Gemmatirosa sp.]|nr:CSLREA domain-containing protein [Gemmatirosa sp.]
MATATLALAACADLAPTAPDAPRLARTGGTALQVNTLADHDDGACTTQDCTLREAIRLAPAGGTITFKSLRGTIALDPTATPATLVIDKGLTIQGPGAGGLTVAMQRQAGRVFRIGAGDVTISGLTITGGAALGAFLEGEGGGIYSDAANLTLRDLRISGNTAERGGGLAILGGNLLTERSTVSGNTASSGGGLYLASRGPTTIVLRQSTVRDNQAAVDGAGILHGEGALALEQSTLSGNVAGAFGGAL